MAENQQRTSGIPGAYKLDRGNAPTQVGMYIGEVRQVVDNTRSGRVKVWIEDFAGPDKNNPDLWRTVAPVSPFYGATNPPTDQQTGEGGYVANKQSYGMWFTPPDIGTTLVCFFASGDSNYGYYLGAVIEPGLTHMLPAIGATRNYKLDNSAQAPYFENAPQLPVVELNINNKALDENPRFFDAKKPVHSVVAAVLLQQGLIKDPVRGPIGSNAQRESPSAAYGISTPGRPIYLGGMSDQDVKQRLEAGAVQPQDATVIARRGGHSFVMDDGDLAGSDQLIRLRTSKGHQITMSDSGDCFYIIHANGQTWMEFGSQGAVDIYSTNSINLRSNGDINMHADRNINMNAKGAINIRGEKVVAIESELAQINASKAMLLYSNSYLGIKSDGSLSLKATQSGTWNGGSNMSLSAGCIALNSGDAPDVPKPSNIIKQSLPDVKFEQNRGWVVQNGALQSIVTRAPTHEPYPFHGRGISTTTSLQAAEASVAVSGEIDAKYDEIQNTEFTAIDAENYETQDSATVSVGSIEPEQVTGMLAQVRVESDQEFNVISDEGVGAYKLTPEQLEEAGYLKPGTVEIYLSDGTATATEILTSPAVWTGQAGVTSVNALLVDPKLQAAVQTDLYQTSLQQLRSAGIVTGSEDPAKLAGLVQAGSKYGPDVVKSWVQGTLSNSPLVASVNQLVRGAQYAVDFSNQKVSDALKGFSTVQPGSTVTTNRTSIDAAVRSVIGNDKVTTPNWSGISSANIEGSNIALLESQLSQISQQIAAIQTSIETLNATIQGSSQRQSGVALSTKRAELYQQLEDLRARQAEIRNQLFV
jgi:hypothetical protein